MNADAQKQIELNVQIHDQIAKRYEVVHGEIFNDVEQERLFLSLEKTLQKVRTGATPLIALDYGCGSGNVTRHLLNLNVNVVAADISEHFLKLVRHRFPSDHLSVLKLNGSDLSDVKDNTFDFIALYSVLHHIPDYITTLIELGRICKTGGIIYLDHENNEEFWLNRPEYKLFKKEALRFDWKKYLVFSNYIHKMHRLFNSKHTNEGDIHVWPDDHIEWKQIADTFTKIGFEIVLSEDYLLFNKLYRPEVYKNYKNKCTDMRVMGFRKI